MEFSDIRKEIERYTKESLINSTIELLRKYEIEINTPSNPIWNVLLLLKWAIIYASDRNYLEKASQTEIEKLCLNIQGLQNNHSFFVEKRSAKKILAILAYQQSYFQFSIAKDSFARQIQLFYKIRSKIDINQIFFEKTELTIGEYIIISFVLFVYVNPEKNDSSHDYDGKIHEDFFNIVESILPRKLEKYLSLLSLELESAHRRLENSSILKREELQSYEISIFTLHPILKWKNEYHFLHRKLFNYTLNYFIYDFLKQNCNQDFSRDFGTRFEKYVELGIKELSLPYMTEADLRNKFGKDSKVIDFLVYDNILIECKAIEQKPYPHVYPDSKVLFNWLKDSLIKAYAEQMITVANKITTQKEIFGIILTYKETYFGNGNDAWEDFLKTPSEKYAQENGLNLLQLPPANLFFIDIATWDKIVICVKRGKATLQEILETAKKNDSSPMTKKFVFAMHLNEYKLGSFDLSYLNEGYKIFDAFGSAK